MHPATNTNSCSQGACFAQLFVWIDQDPDVAFERAGLFFEAAEVTWDLSSVLWNAGVDIFNAGIIPLWNSATYYLVEPAVVLLLEIFSLIFTQQHWTGLFSEADFPYNGLDCMANAEAAAWCGRYGYYKSALESPEYAAGYVDDSTAFAGRRHLVERNYTFGLATARHLQELSGGGFSAPAFDSSALTVALDALASFFVTMLPSLLDVIFGVLMDVIRTSFSILMDALFMVLKSVMFVLKMLVSEAGATQTARAELRSRFCLPVRRVWHAHDRGDHRCRLCDHSAHRDCAADALCGHRRAHVPP